MSDLDDNLEAIRLAEREISLLDQELLDDNLDSAGRAAVQAKLGHLTLKRARISSKIAALSGGGTIHSPTDAERKRLRDVADALDGVAAGNQRASAIIDAVTAAVDVFAT